MKHDATQWLYRMKIKNDCKFFVNDGLLKKFSESTTLTGVKVDLFMLLKTFNILTELYSTTLSGCNASLDVSFNSNS